MQYTTEDVAEEGDEMSIAKKIAKQHAFIDLRYMKYRTYESDHDFYEQLKKAIGYTGATYDGVCERLIELMDDYALERKTEALGEAHKRTMEALATAEARVAELERDGANAEKKLERQYEIFTRRKVAWRTQQKYYERAFLARNARIEELEKELRDAQKVSAERDEAADWVEARGGIDELDKRLMPPGMEWPRFEDGDRVEFGSEVDGLDGPCEKFIFTRSMGGVCQLQDACGRMVNVLHGGRVKRQKPEVLAADGLPIKVDETVYGTGREQDGYKVTSMDKSKAQGRFAVECIGNDGETCMVDPSQLTHTPPDTQERINEEIDECSLDDWCSEHPLGNIGTMIHYYCARQRELDARTMGGDAS